MLPERPQRTAQLGQWTKRANAEGWEWRTSVIKRARRLGSDGTSAWLACRVPPLAHLLALAGAIVSWQPLAKLALEHEYRPPHHTPLDTIRVRYCKTALSAE